MPRDKTKFTEMKYRFCQEVAGRARIRKDFLQHCTWVKHCWLQFECDHGCSAATHIKHGQQISVFKEEK